MIADILEEFSLLVILHPERWGSESDNLKKQFQITTSNIREEIVRIRRNY
jgi:hypothetical protein